VGNFGFDDSQLKTLGLGKQASPTPGVKEDAGWGTVQILIYPAGTQIAPVAKPGPVANSPAKPVLPPA